MKFRALIIVLAFAVLIVAQPLSVIAQPPKGVVAFAYFEVPHGNDCTVTTASVYVYANESYQPGDPIEEQPRVDFHYDILGQPTSPGCDQLWSLYMDGSAPLSDAEFSVSKNRKIATLNKTMQVWEDEAAEFQTVTINVEWVVTPGVKGGTVATLRFPLSLVEPLTTTSAGIRKIGPK
jgi:hypothetical protein